jgi:acetyltransferase-like isoleucine patch superfamily enzyme
LTANLYEVTLKINIKTLSPLQLLRRSIRICRSKWLSRKIDEGNGRFVICDHNLAVNIKKGKSSKIIINGKCRLESFHNRTTPINIFVLDEAKLVIDGDFIIGPGVEIIVAKQAKLTIGGCQNESGAGITCDSRIMVKRKVEIGKDFLCAWGVFITDSDWHLINEQITTKDVVIGDHVWIANNCSVLKGSQIGHGCVIASHSKLAGKSYGNNSLIGGVPAEVIRQPVKWQHDLE